MPEPDSERRQALERASQVFPNRISDDQFLTYYNSLGDHDRRRDFLRAMLLYQSAVRCRDCPSEIARDIEVAILCSSVESISGGNHVLFKDWLLENRLEELANRPSAEIRACINNGYQAFVEHEVNREGIFFNFKRFLLENCPETLREVPLSITHMNPPFHQASFTESLDFVYSRFRSLFLHRGLARATSMRPPDFEEGDAFWTLFADYDRQRRINWSVRLEEFVGWFENVVRESLFGYLTRDR